MTRAPTLTTPRLMLRELREDDAGAIAAGAGDPRVARYLVQVPTPYPVALARRWLRARIEWWDANRGVTFAVVKRTAPNDLLGTVSLRKYARDRRAELGYWLAQRAWGAGIATEANRELVRFGFDRLGLARIYAQVLAGNDASVRVLSKLGMLGEGIRRRHVTKGGVLCDVALYGLLRDEWSPDE